MKKCSRCGEEKELSEFYVRKSGVHRGQVSAKCKHCTHLYRMENRDTKRIYNREYGQKNRDSIRENKRKYRTENVAALRVMRRNWVYGVTLEWYERKLVEQNYECPCCGFWFHTHEDANKNKKPQVDHDHKNGLPRALLCFPCNSALGAVNDSPEILRNLIEYIEPHNKKRELI